MDLPVLRLFGNIMLFVIRRLNFCQESIIEKRSNSSGTSLFFHSDMLRWNCNTNLHFLAGAKPQPELSLNPYPAFSEQVLKTIS